MRRVAWHYMGLICWIWRPVCAVGSLDALDSFTAFNAFIGLGDEVFEPRCTQIGLDGLPLRKFDEVAMELANLRDGVWGGVWGRGRRGSGRRVEGVGLVVGGQRENSATWCNTRAK